MLGRHSVMSIVLFPFLWKLSRLNEAPWAQDCICLICCPVYILQFRVHVGHSVNIYWMNILCIFVSLLAPLPPPLWFFPALKKFAINFCPLNPFHPAITCNSCSLSYPKNHSVSPFSSNYCPIISFSSPSDFKRVVCSRYLHCFITHWYFSSLQTEFSLITQPLSQMSLVHFFCSQIRWPFS